MHSPSGISSNHSRTRDLSSNVELALYNHTIRKKYLEMYPVGEPRKIMPALDPILITDTRGRLSFTTRTPFLDLPEEEILMDYWCEVMMIITDQTNEEVEDPVPEVVRQMLVVTHEFNTSVVTKSGKGRKMSVIVRPVKDDQHDLIRVFINIREKTPDQIKMAKKT